DAAADGRCQRALDPDEVFAESPDRLVGQPGGKLRVRFLAGVDLQPLNLSLAVVGLPHRRVKAPDAGAPDIRPTAVPLNEWNDGAIGHDQLSLIDGYLLAIGDGYGLGTGHDLDLQKT